MWSHQPHFLSKPHRKSWSSCLISAQRCSHNGFCPMEPWVASKRQSAKTLMMSVRYIYYVVPQVPDPSLRSCWNVAAWWRRCLRLQQNPETGQGIHGYCLSAFPYTRIWGNSSDPSSPNADAQDRFPSPFKACHILLLALPSSLLLECCSCLTALCSTPRKQRCCWPHESLSNKSPFPGNERP